jgi:hypothetical protein
MCGQRARRLVVTDDSPSPSPVRPGRASAIRELDVGPGVRGCQSVAQGDRSPVVVRCDAVVVQTPVKQSYFAQHQEEAIVGLFVMWIQVHKVEAYFFNSTMLPCWILPAFGSV